MNTFWIEGPEGLIVIDAQRSLTDARAAVAAIEEDTDLPVAAVLLTHPHPDHVGGVGVFTEAFPEARVYSSQETREFMREDPLGFYELTRSLPGSDYAEELTLPEWLVTPGGQLDLAGVHLESAQFGPGESVTTTVFYEPDSGALFAGDLVGNEVTPALIEGETCGWLADLRHLEHEFHEATVLYPGHGEPGDPHELIEAQRHYLEEIRHLVLPTVRESSPGGAALTEAETEELVAELTEAYPDHRPVATLPDLHAVNVEAVAAELREAPAGQSCH
ncbi:MBL fold metallo-hydrolase [Streptomyces sp. DSM 44917]|uniref:MBL fold metallo-hydrolase n=1 Tax=Streptomyces boetiae TaxID=3075541 RepID=A0ABU2LDQ0_9ACTN|nr:MBL fold metallo-hydrolase [Streptomyces sp. DSM 44917]MDT0309696.1 MBL fold metallo-hydrolase [Streptomyces sp. DSM 44917]